MQLFYSSRQHYPGRFQRGGSLFGRFKGSGGNRNPPAAFFLGGREPFLFGGSKRNGSRKTRFLFPLPWKKKTPKPYGFGVFF